jgi:hypothetical protein
VTIGLISDLHLGGTGEGRWHNRLLYERSEAVARAAVAALREHESVSGGGPDRYRLGPDQSASVIAELERARPTSLILLSHQPLISDAERAAPRGGKDAGHYADGGSLLAHSASLADCVAAFAAHQHWHHLVEGPGWLHCVTASLIEYPMEARIVSWEDGEISSRLIGVAPDAAARSLDGQAWVRGDDRDREWQHAWAR